MGALVAELQSNEMAARQGEEFDDTVPRWPRDRPIAPPAMGNYSGFAHRRRRTPFGPCGAPPGYVSPPAKKCSRK
jgi:hypothetical protein